MHTIDPFSESSLEGIELTGFSRVVEGRVEEEGASRPYDALPPVKTVLLENRPEHRALRGSAVHRDGM